MKKIILVLLILSSCAPKVIPLKGSYSNGNFQQVTNKPKDAVWDNIIDLFAQRGLPIKLIDRSSGLIVSGETILTWTYENKKGELVKPDADVVIAQVYDPGANKVIKPASVSGEWNIRIKDAGNGRTSINVNLVSPKYISALGKTPTLFTPGVLQSTGNFERMVFDIIK